jgi:hypothetical protein
MTRRAQMMFAGFFLAVVSVPPLLQAGVEIARGRRPQFLDLFFTPPVRPRLRAWEHELEQASVIAQAVRPWVQYVWFKLLDYAGEKVLLGREDWLFYKPDVRYLVEPAAFDAAHEDPYPAILDFRDQLARQGTMLIVLPMPGKPSIYPEKLTARAEANGIRSHTLDLIRRLQAAGVETIDLFHAFEKAREADKPPIYLRRDTHWSPQAAEAAAEIVAARVRALGIEEGNATYQVRNVSIQRPGDIVKMIQSPGIANVYISEQVQASQVIGFKDDPSSPVLVLGDSFLRIYQTDEPRSAGFIAHLARALRMPLATIVNDGGASTLVRQELARRTHLLRGKKLLLWEFVERDIRFGTEGWKLIPLPVSEGSREPNPK